MSKKKKNLSKNIKVTSSGYELKKLDSRTKYIAFGGFILLAFLLYFQCLGFGYVLDDKLVITDNNFTKNGFSGLWDILSTDSFQGYFGEQKNLLQGGRYRPLSIMSFAIEHQFFGLNSTVSHIINVLLYGLGGYIAFITLRRLFKENETGTTAFISLAFLSSVLFLIHPIHTEAVANIKGRDEIMSFIFSILSLLYALRFADLGGRKNLLLMVAMYFLGILSKENTITFLAIIPFALLLFRKHSKSAAVKTGVVLLITTIVYLVLRYAVMGYLLNENSSTDIMNNPFYGMEGTEKLATVLYTLILYLKLSIFPHPLTHDYYPYHIPIMNFGKLIVWLSIIVHLVLGLSVFYFWKKNRKIAFAIGFYLAALSIVSNLVVNVGTFMNERFVFTASLGVCIIMVLVFFKLDQLFGTGKQVLFALMAIVFLGFGYKTIDRVPAWESAMTLNSEAIKVSKNSARANSFMSTALFNEYRESTDREEKLRLLTEAQPYARKAVSIVPNYSNGNLMRAGIAAELHKMNGDLDALLAEFKDIMMLRPDVNFLTEYLNYLNPRQDINRMMEFYIDIGRTMIQQRKNLTWAVHYLKMAYELDESNLQVKALMHEALTILGYHEEAAKYR